MAPGETAPRARLAFGFPAQVKEECRDARGTRWFEQLVQGLSYGVRMLRLNPAFGAVRIVSLALGIGANTAMFQLLDSVRLRTLPVESPDELQMIRICGDGPTGNFTSRYSHLSYPQWEQIQARQRAFSPSQLGVRDASISRAAAKCVPPKACWSADPSSTRWRLKPGAGAIANLLALKLQNMRNKHAITLEYLRMGALKGVILDADGSTLYDLYSEFGITAKTVAFCAGHGRHRSAAEGARSEGPHRGQPQGEFMTGILCQCSQLFYDAFTTHAKVKEAFQYDQRNQQLGNDYRTGFTFGGVTFEEYRGQATDSSGNVRKFIADDEAHFFPLGTANTFRTFFAPADFNETANALDLALYAKQEPRKFGRGTDLHTQQNPLPICLRPEVLVKGTKT